MTSYIGYLRVSTVRQGRSGLGLEAQKARITEFVGNDQVGWFIETESGANCQRVELEKALTQCELTGSTLLVATLDRLSRDVAFLEQVKARCEAGSFGFRCVDMPDANSFMLGVMAQLAQYERERISARTKAALQAAKRRGVKLGNPNGAKPFDGHRELGAERAAESHRTTADTWAEKRRPILVELVEAGLSLSGMARELTARKISTRRGGKWHARGVKALLARLDLAPATVSA